MGTGRGTAGNPAASARAPEPDDLGAHAGLPPDAGDQEDLVGGRVVDVTDQELTRGGGLGAVAAAQLGADRQRLEDRHRLRALGADHGPVRQLLHAVRDQAMVRSEIGDLDAAGRAEGLALAAAS